MIPCSVITGDDFQRHDCPGHPECEARLDTARSGIPRGVNTIKPVMGDPLDLEGVHDPAYIALVRERCEECPSSRCSYLDPDTYITNDSFHTALLAAGSSVEAVRRGLDGSHCFAMVRPPGHHAGIRHAMGFCIINNAAVAAVAALEQCDRVAILDWDVHHGNGTQEIFYSDNRVLYCSLHQSFHYPNTGWPGETGVGPGDGYTLNIPLPAGSTIREYRDAFVHSVIPRITSFSPDLLVVSAGQDCLHDDPLGGINLYPRDFIELTHFALSCTKNPIAFVLEGGYGPSHGDAIRGIFETLMAG